MGDQRPVLGLRRRATRARAPGVRSPFKYRRTVSRLAPTCRAIAEIVQPCLRSACTSTTFSHV
jgi:hypothetical protein